MWKLFSHTESDISDEETSQQRRLKNKDLIFNNVV